MNDLQHVAYNAIVSRLAASRAFGNVLLDVRGRAAGGSEPSPLAIVAPESWSDSTIEDPSTVLRRASYRLILLVRADDPRSRFSESNRLAGAASALLNGADFGDGFIPSLSRIERGDYRDAPGSGESSCELGGTFSFLVPGAPAVDSPEIPGGTGPHPGPEPVAPAQN